MALTFAEYWQKRTGVVVEMAQSRDPGQASISLDDKDDDFIDQVLKGSKKFTDKLTETGALRARYTTLLQDKPGEAGVVRVQFPGRSKDKWMRIPVERTHLKHLQDKLRAAGLDHTAENGFAPNDESLTPDQDEFYDTAFSKQNSQSVMKSRVINVNYGRATNTRVELTRGLPSAPTDVPPEAPKKGRGKKATAPVAAPVEPPKRVKVILKPLPKDWSSQYFANVFKDSPDGGEHKSFLDLHQLGGNDKNPQYDFSDVWKAVSTLVGEPEEKDKYILPEVWELFQQAQPGAGNTIFAGVRRKLMEFSPEAVQDPLELKQALMQTTATILANPTRGGKRAKTDDFISDVRNLFMAGGASLASYAASIAGTTHLRKTAGINTNNTRKQEIGGNKQSWTADAQPNLDDMGNEDAEFGSDEEIEREIRTLEPKIEKLRYKLNKADWDFDVLTDDERDLFAHFEKMNEKLRDIRGERPGDKALGKRAEPVVQKAQTDVAAKESQLKALAPKALPLIKRIEMARGRPTGMSPADLKLIDDYEALELEIKRLKRGDAKPELDDIYANQGSYRTEGATLGPLDPNNPDFQVEGDPCSQVILGFNAWCKKRERKKGWDGVK